jgi:hypothetical protein
VSDPAADTMPRCRTCLHWAAYGTGRGVCTLADEGPAVSLHSAIVLIARGFSGPYQEAEGRQVTPTLFARGCLETDGGFGCVSHEVEDDRP